MPETWQTYRRALAGALGWHLFTSQSSAAASTASNVVLCPELIDSNLESNFLDTTWEYQPTGTNAGEVRRVSKGGLATGTGIVTLSRAHTAVTSSATSVEFYGVLPPTRHLGRRGLLQAANYALSECWTIDHLAITGVSTAYQYSLSAYPWLQNEDQVIDLWVRKSGEVRDNLIPQWRWVADADTPQFEVKSPLSSADTLKLKVYRPLDTWINVNSSWGESSVGLVNETDQGLLSENAMVMVGLYYCYEFLASEGDVSQRGFYRGLADRQRIKANKWKEAMLPTDNGRDVHWQQFISFGPATLQITNIST